VSALLVLVAAAGITLAILFAALWWSGAQPDLPQLARWGRSLPRGAAAAGLVAAGVVGVQVARASGILVLGLLVAILVAGVPEFFVGAKLWARRVDQTKAVAMWTRMLSEQTAAGVGIRKALRDTAARVPVSIREPALALAASLASSGRFDDGARPFAQRLQDEEVDVLVASLSMVSAGRAGDVASALAELAKDCQETASSRQRSDTDRTEDRTSARVIALIAALSFALMAWSNRDLITSLSGPVGQLVLAVGGGLFVTGHRLMAGMDRPPRTYRHVLPEAPG
jgi:tight adherence protein B